MSLKPVKSSHCFYYKESFGPLLCKWLSLQEKLLCPLTLKGQNKPLLLELGKWVEGIHSINNFEAYFFNVIIKQKDLSTFIGISKKDLRLSYTPIKNLIKGHIFYKLELYHVALQTMIFWTAYFYESQRAKLLYEYSSTGPYKYLNYMRREKLNYLQETAFTLLELLIKKEIILFDDFKVIYHGRAKDNQLVAFKLFILNPLEEDDLYNKFSNILDTLENNLLPFIFLTEV